MKIKKNICICGIILIINLIILTSVNGLLNPAAVYCSEMGYNHILENSPEGIVGKCVLPDSSEVDAWDFFQGKVRQDQSYCFKNGMGIETVLDPEMCKEFLTDECAVCVLGGTVKIEMTNVMGIGFKETSCGDGTCGLPENQQTCPADCDSGEFDNFCDGLIDGKCDPDCDVHTDPDCFFYNGSMQVSLFKGWNIIGYPGTVPTNISNVFGSLNNSLLAVLGYEQEVFFDYIPTREEYLNSLKLLEPNLGYLVKAKEDMVLEFDNGEFERCDVSVEVCYDEEDNDCDGKADCSDEDCFSDVDCYECLSDSDCDDLNECTDEVCNLNDHTCEYSNNQDTCEDGNGCTTGDYCFNGECNSGAALDCDDNNVCTDDFCDVFLGCKYNFNNNPCDDNDACTENDFCSGGVCEGYPVDCTDGNFCTDDLCDPVSGCMNPFNMNPCDDGDLCTINDTCVDGLCAGEIFSCDDSNECTDETCDSLLGCIYTNNDGDCDDGNACTENDYCIDGGCYGDDIECSDGNDCTDDNCNPVTGCYYLSDDANECDDNNPCTEFDYCSFGTCTGSLRNCNDNNVCTNEYCDGLTGDCVYVFNTNPCNDGDACTEDEQCLDGVCVGDDIDCGDDLLCTYDNCNGGVCSNPLKPGNCLINGICYSNGQVNPQNTCQECNTAISTTSWTNDNSNGCSDNDPCTLGDYCSAGSCISGTPKDCNDFNVCTDDACFSGTGTCVYQYNSDSCNDGNACTENDVCSEGSCSAGTAVDCNDGNGCTDDYCSTLTGCYYVDNSDPCNDGDLCTTGDVCNGGVCSGNDKNCDDGNVCTDDACFSGTGACVYINNNDPCSDGNACTGGDTCSSGSCSGQTEECCANSIDDDIDINVDCLDTDCIGDSNCPTCVADFHLDCGDNDQGTNYQTGSTDVINSYSCSTWTETGNEYTYSFSSRSTRPVTVTLSGMTADLDIFVIEDSALGCSPEKCVAFGNVDTTFTATAYKTYYLVVDGYNGASGPYTIDVSCG